jgi:hypothetical protein
MKKVMLGIDRHIVEVAITRPDYVKQGRAPHLVLTATCGSTVLETPIPVKLRGNRARARHERRRAGQATSSDRSKYLSAVKVPTY